MSDLQLSLLVIGAMVVGAVLVYNWLQERSFRRRLKQAFGEAPEDVLLRREPETARGAERVEPQLTQASGAARLARPAQQETIPDRAHAGPAELPEARLDPALDYVAEIELHRPLAATAV